MRLGKKHHFRLVNTVLVLVLSLLLGLVLVPVPVHAAPIIFKAKANNPNGFSPMTIGPLTIALGDALVVNEMYYGTGGEGTVSDRSEEHTSELQSPCNL